VVPSLSETSRFRSRKLVMRQRSTIGSGITEGTHLDRAFLLIATLCVAMMPSIYNGGAEIAHPHGLFQFWHSGPERAFDHHHSGEHDHEGHDHAPACPTTDGDRTAACREEAGAALATSANSDNPQASPSVPPGGTTEAIAAALGAVVLLLGAVPSKLRYPALSRSWLGRFTTPEPPPPRFAKPVFR
jgi:hypothetical protein